MSRSIPPEVGSCAGSIKAPPWLPAAAGMLLVVLTACARHTPQRKLPVRMPVDARPTRAEPATLLEPAPASDWSNVRPDLRPDELWPTRFEGSYLRINWGSRSYILHIMHDGVLERTILGWEDGYIRCTPGAWHWDGDRLHLRDAAGTLEVLHPCEKGLCDEAGKLWGLASQGVGRQGDDT